MDDPVVAARGVPAERPYDVEALPRKLGGATLFLLIVAYNAPIAAMSGFVQLAVGFGNGLGAPAAFLMSGAILLLFAVGFIGMSRYVRNAGAFYRYIVDALGRSTGLGAAFLAAVSYILALSGSYIYIGVIGADLHRRVAGADALPWQAWSAIFFVIILVLGLLRIDVSMKALGLLVVIESVAVAIYSAVVLVRGGPEGYSAASWTPENIFSGSVGLSLLFAVICMIGIESGAVLRDEVRNPAKNVSRATYGAITFMALLYALGTWCYIITQGASSAVGNAAADPVGSFLTSVQVYLGNVFITTISVVLVTSQLAASNAIMSSASRYLYNFGRDRVLPRPLAAVHSRLQSPWVAVLTVSAVGGVFLAAVLLTQADPIVAVGGLAGMSVYFFLPVLIATSAAVIVFFRRNRHLNPNSWVAYVAPALSCLALTALVAVVTLEISALIPNPATALTAKVGVVIVPLAGCLLARHFKKNRPHIYAAIGDQ